MADTLTIILLVAYLLVCLYIGLKSRKKEDTEGYLIANRKVGLFKSIATISAGYIGAQFLLVNMSFVFIWGISTAWIFIGLFIGFLIFSKFGVFLKKRSEKKKYYTLADYCGDRSGKYMAIIATISVFIIYFGILTGQFIGGAKVLQVVSGWSYILSLGLIAIVVLTYLLLGGFKSVVKTDVVQFLIILIVPALLIFTITSGIHVPIGHLNIFNAGIVNIIGFLLFGIFSNFFYADLWQRVYSAKDEETVKKSFIISGIIVLVFGAILTYIALIVRSIFTNIDPDSTAIYGFTQLIPQSLVALSLLLLFAIVMSSIDTIVFVLASSFSKDVMAKIKKNNSKKEQVKYLKIGLIIFTFIGVIIALFYSNMASIALVFTSLGGSMAPYVFISWFKKKLNKAAVIISWVITLVTILITVFGLKMIHPGLGLIAIVFSFGLYGLITLIMKIFKKYH